MTESQQPQRISSAQHTPFPMVPALQGRTKADFELVVARYDEDIRWTDAYAPFRTVYNKGAPDLSCDAISLKNEGHLADTILQHILLRYDSLATTTFFAHGSINYRADQQIVDGVAKPGQKAWSDFITVNPRALVFLSCTDHFRKGERAYDYPETMEEVYRRLFDGKPYVPRFDWGTGLWMSVGRQLIRRRPKAFWERWLAWLHAPPRAGGPITQEEYRTRGVYLERFFIHAFQTGP